MKRRILPPPPPSVDLRIGGYEITGNPRLSDHDLQWLQNYLSNVRPPRGLVTNWYALMTPDLPVSIVDIMNLETSHTTDVRKYEVRRV